MVRLIIFVSHLGWGGGGYGGYGRGNTLSFCCQKLFSKHSFLFVLQVGEAADMAVDMAAMEAEEVR